MMSTDEKQDRQIADLERGATIRENVTIGVAVFGTIVAIAAVIISYLQWSVMREQLADAREGAAQANAATQRALRSAESQAGSLRMLAGATSDLVKATDRGLVWSERAWVHCDSVTSDPPSPEGGNPRITGRILKLQFLITNNGRSPAENVTIEVIGELVPKGKQPNFRKRYELVVREHATIPNNGELTASTDHVTAFGTDRGIGPLTDDEVATFANGMIRIFAFGRLTFKDVFGGAHWMRFCFYYRPQYGWTRYQLGNDEGEGAAPW